MTIEEESARLNKLEKGIAEAKTKLNKRRAELREKDFERRKAEFDKLPLKERRIREAIGWSPYQDGEVIYRTCGEILPK